MERSVSYALSRQSTSASNDGVANTMHTRRTKKPHHEFSSPPHLPAEYLHNLPSEHPDPFMNIDNPITYKRFRSSGNKIAELDFELGRFYSDIRQLAMSARILQTVSDIRPCLAELGNALQANVLHILPHTLEITQLPWMRGDSEVPDAGSNSVEFFVEIAGRDLVALTHQLRDRLGDLRTSFRPFPDFSSSGIINVFSPLRRFLRSILIAADDLKTLGTPPARVALYRLFAELGAAVTPLTHVIHHITEFVLPSLQASQTNRLFQPQMLLGVATLLSGITATTLQMTVSINNLHGIQATLVAVINLLWLASLMCSITCALNTLLSMVWLQSSYRDPDSLVPKPVEFWIVKSPNWLLLASAWIFAMAMYLLPWVLLEKWARPILTPFYALPVAIIGSAMFWMRQEQRNLIEKLAAQSSVAPRLKGKLLWDQFPVFWRNISDTKKLSEDVEDFSLETAVNRPADIESLQVTNDDRFGQQDNPQSLRRRSTVASALSTRTREQIKSAFRKVLHSVIFTRSTNREGMSSPQDVPDARTELSMIQRDYAAPNVLGLTSVDLVLLSPKGEYLVAYRPNKQVTIIRLEGEKISPITFQLEYNPSRIDWFPSQWQLLCQYSNGLEVWNMDGRMIKQNDLQTLSVSSFDHGDSTFMCAAFDEKDENAGGNLRILNGDVETTHSFSTGRFRVSGMVCLPKKEIVICVGRNDWGRDNLPQWSPGLHRLMVYYNPKEEGRPSFSVVTPLFGPVREITMDYGQNYFLISYEEESRQAPQLWSLIEQPNARSGREPNAGPSSQQLSNSSSYNGPKHMIPTQTYHLADERCILQGSAQFCGIFAQLIYCQDKDGWLHIWPRKSHKELYRMQVGTKARPLTSITWSTQSKLAFFAGFKDGTIEYWSEGEQVNRLSWQQRLASIVRRDNDRLDFAPIHAAA